MSNAESLALSEEEVAAELKRVSTPEKLDELNKLYEKYSNAISAILTMAAKQSEDDEKELVQIERLKRIIGFAPVEERFIRSKDKVWNVRDHILAKDASYFLKKDYSAHIKKDHNQAFLERIIEIVRDKFISLSEEHQEFYWKKAMVLLNCVAKYKQLTA